VSGERHPIGTYAEFWPYYLREHARPETRGFHIAGTVLAAACCLAGLILGDWRLIPLALLAGYGPAWAAHLVIEKNRPATFRYPVWSLISDVRMTVAWLTGRLGRELERTGISTGFSPPS
jgi:hypothetical protein